MQINLLPNCTRSLALMSITTAMVKKNSKLHIALRITLIHTARLRGQNTKEKTQTANVSRWRKVRVKIDHIAYFAVYFWHEHNSTAMRGDDRRRYKIGYHTHTHTLKMMHKMYVVFAVRCRLNTTVYVARIGPAGTV